MQTSVIRHRVADFLKRFAPFDALPEQELLDLASGGRVKFHESDEFIYRQGDARPPMVWLIQQGRVELVEDGAGEEFRDVLGEGDLLGLECFIGDRSCLYAARTASDVILYGIRTTQFELLISRYPAVKHFLEAHFSVAAHLGVGRRSWLDAEPPPAEFLRERLTTLAAGAAADEAQRRLGSARNGVVAMVDSDGRPTAMVTSINGCGGPNSPPPTMTAAFTTRTAVGEMLRWRSEAVAITADGTRESRVEAILTASELALFCGYDPVRLVNAIRRARSAAELVPLLRQAGRMVLDGLARPRDVDDCCRIKTEVAEALTQACFSLAREVVLAAGIDPPAVPCCWVSVGGFARGDHLEQELPAIAVIYDDAAEGFQTQDSVYFTALTGEALAWFHTCGIGDTDWRWPTGSVPCMPLSEWTRFYCETIRNPLEHALYARRELFDLRMLSGDKLILQKMQAGIMAELRDHGTAIPLLANDTLAHLPPLTFFRGLVLGMDGEQRETFDIGRTAIAPITDAARVFAIAGRRLARANTLERLETAARDFPEGAEILGDGANAFRVALYYQTEAGREIKPGRLGKLDQRLLKTAFSSIHRLLDFTENRFILGV